MARIRHIAIASDHPGKAADFFKAAFGLREIRRQGLDGDPEIAPRPSAVGLTDGELNITFIKPTLDQTGVGMDFVGLHHFGFQVEDLDEQTDVLTALGAPCIAGKDAIPPGAHQEIKFRGPDGVVFDIADLPWPGTPAKR